MMDLTTAELDVPHAGTAPPARVLLAAHRSLAGSAQTRLVP
jgi:hypothetical protein